MGNLLLLLMKGHCIAFLEEVDDLLPSICLVIPVWNDADRLEVFGPSLAEALLASGLKVRWIVADDGSSVEQRARLEEVVTQLQKVYAGIELLLCRQRSRKGGAVYQAWDLCADADFLAFVDCDGAIGAESILDMIKSAVHGDMDRCVVGIRRHGKDVAVHRSWQRMLACRIFSGIVYMLLGIRFMDTQCGAKVISGSAYRAVADRLSERGFVFDVELLLALEKQGVAIEELAIPWTEIAGSKMSPARDAWGMLTALLRIRKRLQQGSYHVC